MELDEVLDSRQMINQRIADELEDASRGWDVTIRRVQIQELRVDEQTRRAMTQQMEAERRRRAQIAEAEANYLRRLKEEVGSEQVARILLAEK
jgi:regulator of protease activity HflC (stomatin/prohibitin superfamily)